MRGLRSSAMSAMAGCVMVILVIMAASTSSKPMGERTELQQDMRPMPEGSHRLRSQKTARLAYLNRQVRARQMALWDFEEGGPTAADVGGTNYNPVVLDDAVSREGYPPLNRGWEEWGCGGSDSMMNEYPCSHYYYEDY
uniref:Uncharacterized protein n=1 Tax=Hanusia phi TaxID=3032 RepID=A0A7S0NE88_9CRYP